MKNIKSSLKFLAIAILSSLVVFTSCDSEKPADTSSSKETPAVSDTSSESAESDGTETDSKNNDEEIVETNSSDTYESEDDGEKENDESSAGEKNESEEDGDEKPAVKKDYGLYNFLTGAKITEEDQKKRPVAIMVNNIRESLPQIGISNGELFYEIPAEGGVTRLMMLCSDYTKLGTIGSIRSSRDYFVDMLYNHDALYVHAGGSERAYDKLHGEKISHMDGVTMYLPTTFWRDAERLKTMSLEHTLMTSGKGISDAVESLKYRTEIKDSYYPMLKFFDEKTNNVPKGSPATHVHMISTPYQTVDFVYDEKTGEYLRYQYNGMKHVDGVTGEQLSFKNVIVLFTDIALIPGDNKGRLTVKTIGEGQGYYITNGQRKVINWSRGKQEDVMQLEYKNGDELVLNCGKTFICIVDESVTAKIDFEYKW